jgi:serine-type D-Ala-D-Ala carboxypeptidase/endopeptidase (penicillin-binding protein 4)
MLFRSFLVSVLTLASLSISQISLGQTRLEQVNLDQALTPTPSAFAEPEPPEAARLLLPAAPIQTARSLPVRIPQGRICPSQLQGQINRIVQRDRSVKWGIHVESIDYPGELYSYNAEQYLIPASNVKLLTTTAALQAVYNSLEGPWKGFDSQLATVNRHSDNEYANAMLKRIGGVGAVQTHLANLGVSPQGYRQVDGSGLSRNNLATPLTLVGLLKAAQGMPGYSQFYQSLPVAGESGTLGSRLGNPLVKGRVHAKTGTLTGVRALSGYMEHPIFGTIVFSILANQPNRGDTLRQSIDEIVTTIGRMYPCS